MTDSLTEQTSKQESKQTNKQTNTGTRASAHFKGQQDMQLRMLLDKPPY